MFRMVLLLVLFTAFTFVMWENLEQKASIYFLGSTVFESVPVLLIILSSMLLGMFVMLPFVWLNRLRAQKKEREKEKERQTKTEKKTGRFGGKNKKNTTENDDNTESDPKGKSKSKDAAAKALAEDTSSRTGRSRQADNVS